MGLCVRAWVWFWFGLINFGFQLDSRNETGPPWIQITNDISVYLRPSSRNAQGLERCEYKTWWGIKWPWQKLLSSHFCASYAMQDRRFFLLFLMSSIITMFSCWKWIAFHIQASCQPVAFSQPVKSQALVNSSDTLDKSNLWKSCIFEALVWTHYAVWPILHNTLLAAWFGLCLLDATGLVSCSRPHVNRYSLLAQFHLQTAQLVWHYRNVVFVSG